MSPTSASVEKGGPSSMRERPPYIKSWGWLGWSLLVFAMVATLTVLFVLHTRRVVDDTIAERVSKARARTAHRIANDLQLAVDDTRLIRDQIQLGTLKTSSQFEESGRALRQAISSIEAIGWIAADGHFQGEASADEAAFGKASVAGLGQSTADAFMPSDAGASKSASARIITFPIAERLPGGGVRPAGAVVLKISLADLIDATAPNNSPILRSMRVEDKHHQVVASSGDQAPFLSPNRPLPSDIVSVLDETFSVRFASSGSVSALRVAEESKYLLIVGVLLATLAAALVGYMTRSRSKMQWTTQTHLNALESLQRVAAMIGMQAQPPDEVLERLMDATCQLLQIPKAFVCGIEPDEMIRLIYHTGFQDTPPNWIVRRFDETRGIRQCIVTRQPLYVADVANEGNGIVDVQRLLHYNMRAVLMMPMQAGDELLGVMVLADRVPRIFTEEEQHIALLWAAQCAVTLVNQRLANESEQALRRQQQLTDQIQRDAQAKELLLREMNHRVKNNMAGIVGLLSSGAPGLSEAAQRWLDRAIARIQTLARAHELFVGFSEEVSLHDLIDKTLAPVHAMMPSGAHLTITGQVSQALSTDKAVTLAMVLNELATNALEHGLGRWGELIVHVERTNAQTIRIKVSDDGSGNKPGDTADISGTGMGLKLVRGLVSRELRGRFDIAVNGASGTVAVVEFPAGDMTSSPGVSTTAAKTTERKGFHSSNGNDHAERITETAISADHRR